jgi:SNW domain-containing protein 1
MVEAQVDPMEPPKHKIKKVPRGGGSPPVPVLHSPPRNLTVKDQQAWKIPPCVSNWKNARGYTIPLDKRLAADGRGLQEVTINSKFASLSETLYIAERKAAEDLRVRNQIRKRMAMKEKEDKEKELREMASKARMERAGVLGGGEEESSYYQRTQDDHDSDEEAGSRRAPAPYEDRRERGSREGGRGNSSREGGRGNSSGDEEGEREEGARPGESAAEHTARIQRERLRIERRKERERELRLENMKVG